MNVPSPLEVLNKHSEFSGMIKDDGRHYAIKPKDVISAMEEYADLKIKASIEQEYSTGTVVSHGPAQLSYPANDFVVTDTDIDLTVRLFLNPKQWFWPPRVRIFWDSMNGYGFRFLCLYAVVNITRTGYFKNEIYPER